MAACLTCGKGPRAIWYCRRSDCPRIYVVPLPRPDVAVTSKQDSAAGTHEVEITISRENVTRTYTGAGATHDEAARKGIEGVLGDVHTAEWLPPAKKPA